jgi:hypothetical protein
MNPGQDCTGLKSLGDSPLTGKSKIGFRISCNRAYERAQLLRITFHCQIFFSTTPRRGCQAAKKLHKRDRSLERHNAVSDAP